MKLKKTVSGVLSVLLLSCPAFSAITASGADNTVKISASKETADAGSQFTVSVSLSDIPETGIQGADFAVQYDSSLVSIDKVNIGKLADTGADDVDNIDALPTFTSKIVKEKNAVVVSFTVASGNSDYYMKGDGVMFTITGTALESAAEGSVAEFNIIPIPRKVNNSGNAANNNKIFLGYDSDPNPDDDISNYITYDSEVSDGSVTIGVKSDVSTLKGDVTLDGKIDSADVVAAAAYVGNPQKNPLGKQPIINGDVHSSGDGLTANDALMIQQFLAKIVTKF